MERIAVKEDPQTNGSSVIDLEEPELEGEVVWLRRDHIKPDPNQPREWFDETKLQELAASIASAKQKVAIIVIRSFMNPNRFIIVDGERRWRACGMVGVKKMKAIISTEQDERERFRDSVIVNFNREGHTVMETAHAVAKIKKDFDLNNAKVAELFGKSEGWVNNHLSLFRLAPEVIALMHPSVPRKQRLVISVALQLVPLTQREQKKFAKDFCAGKISAKSARVSIVKHRLMKGTATKIRVSPQKTNQKISGFTARAAEDSELTVMLGEETFLDTFKASSTAEIDVLIANLEKAEKNIAIAKGYLRNARSKLQT